MVGCFGVQDGLDYKTRMLQSGRAAPYFIWPNINPFRARGSTLDGVFAPGTANDCQKWRRRSSPEMPYRCRDASSLTLRLVLPGGLGQGAGNKLDVCHEEGRGKPWIVD